MIQICKQLKKVICTDDSWEMTVAIKLCSSATANAKITDTATDTST